MHGVYTVDQIRAAEAALSAKVGDGVLMQRAAAALAAHCERSLSRVYGARVVLLVGAGNNGGDALFAGARLARRGAVVTAVLVDPGRAHTGGLVELRASGGRIAGAVGAGGVDLVIDGILGIGGRGGLRAAAVAAARDCTLAGAPIVAVDLPSGVDADTGLVHETSIRADITVTFGALKVGLVSGGGPAAAGDIRLVDIGLGPHLPEPTITALDGDDVGALLPRPDAAGDKYSRGVVGVVAGSSQYAGAGVLATGSAVHGGAGMVRYLGGAPDGIRDRYPEVVVHADTEPAQVRVQSFVVGPGLGTDQPALESLQQVLAAQVPVVIDADAITLLAGHESLQTALRRRHLPTVLTPHDREFTRLFDLDADRVASARTAARVTGATVLLKGNATVIAEPSGRVWLNRTGTPWLATAGSGDVLSGLIGSLLAAGLPGGPAAAAAAHLHGLAGQLAAADGPPSAADVLGSLRPAWHTVLGNAYFSAREHRLGGDLRADDGDAPTLRH